MSTAIPRLVIAGVTSGVGKTTITAGIIGALRRRGLRVQPFKCGPDYIDPSHLSRAAGVPARNLDSWMLPHQALREFFVRACQGADIAVIEGMMGLFDGRSGEDDTGSTAQIAKLLDAPVALVMDVGAVARSAAATALGFQRFDPACHVAAVILNQVGGGRHRDMVATPLAGATGLPVLGAIPRSEALRQEERHLGLVPEGESPLAEEALGALVDVVSQHTDLEGLLALARQASPVVAQASGLFPPAPRARRARIAVAQDRAFSFYYQENFELLEAWGAELVSFSPLTDQAPPSGVQGLYIGGGFPELYARELAANKPMLRAVAEAAAAGMPVVAECGGLMYLAQGIADFEGVRHPMAGLVPGTCVMQRRRVGLGYLSARARQDTPLLARGETVRAHEFHWSRLERDLPPERAAFEIEEQPGRLEGYARGNLLASYAHVHFGARPDLAPRFVEACRAWGRGG
ncbi:MAG: cobyrinate a,c-diamide synthase [Chloroflexi bacterium]|nr:cobyrinate a,c-diamide synthase [Chloroflexota bacterium]